MDSQLPPDAPELNPQPSPPPAQAPLQNVFIGPRGLRAGWKLLAFIVLLFMLGKLLSPVFHLLFKSGAKSDVLSPRISLISEFLQAITVLAATGILARFVDRKPWNYFGIPPRRALGGAFWYGAAVGLGVLALQLCLMHLGGWFDFGPLRLHGFAIVKYGLVWGAMFFLVGIVEEGMLRGYPQRVLTDGMGFWPSALLLSVVFACLHISNPGENAFGIFMVFVDGMVMCFAVWRTGDLWFAIGNHAAWDWGMTYLFGTPNSGMRGGGALMSPSFHGPKLLAGGSAGPEGSVLVLLSEALIVLSIALAYRRRQYPLLADEPETAALPAPESSPAMPPPGIA